MELADYLAALGGAEVAVHLPGMAEERAALEACNAAGKTVVGLDTGPKVVITADGVVDNGVVRCLKDEVDRIVPDAQCVIVLRHMGDAALAPTLDAYLDVRMIEGRDVWLEMENNSST